MKKSKLIFGFLPWIAFSSLYGSTFHSVAHLSFMVALLILIFSTAELKKAFILPWCSLVFFSLLGFNDQFHLVTWLSQHAMLILNTVLALIMWLSLAINRPFTIQYAKEETDKAAWNSPLFKQINYTLTIIWAVLMTIAAIPAWAMPQAQYLHSSIWNYGLSIVTILAGVYATIKLPPIMIGRNFWHTVKNLPPVNTKYLKNGYAPVLDEVELTDLIAEGVIPVELNGTYMRNGPNPYFTPYTYHYPIDGDGMIHAMYFNNGKVRYKNRFIATKGLLAEKKAGCALYAGIALPIPPDPTYIDDDPVKILPQLMSYR
jgi:carotenoid cleavage dioxygenase